MDAQNIQEENKSYGAGSGRREFRRQGRNRQCMNKNSSSIFGIVLVVVGGLIIASRAGLGIPSWVLSWPMILITVGLVVGISTGFRRSGWFVPLLIGLFFLLDDILPGFFPREYFWPALLVVGGILLIFRPFRNRGDWFTPRTENGPQAGQQYGQQADQQYSQQAGTTETWQSGQEDATGGFGSTGTSAAGHSASYTGIDGLNETAVFGNVRKILVTKNFSGGEVSAVFGSAEINLLQTDFQQPPHLELNAVFGSIKLVVPSHWQVKFESNAVLGGIEDKRPRHTIYSDKVLYLEANAVFGGIQIESH
ncbi:hypothetical protein ACFSQD_09550 [Flavihumibacter stibioxidans]|uniref:LiaF transmembrane domain-containing protein n=1 Tax=Flavihumibacter stibioxidans TaxID=1834163 RepID=A0ABR7M6V3_9BACT|nr:hypothetical protein [Flavihumibacter stibioxidans]MBC6490559.1 hypothetical protein [Flavihumibacter stibioxidans]